MRKIILAQFIVLLLGTLFAWTNFILELVSWLKQRACVFACGLSVVKNPFLTPCFYGALFFAIAFVLSCIIVKNKKNV